MHSDRVVLILAACWLCGCGIVPRSEGTARRLVDRSGSSATAEQARRYPGQPRAYPAEQAGPGFPLDPSGEDTGLTPSGAADASTPAAGMAAVSPAGATQTRPTVSGMHLQLAPGETATQRALEFKEKLSKAQVDNEALTQRVRQLQSEVEQKQQALSQADAEVQAAQQELGRFHEESTVWIQQMRQLRERARRAEEEKLDTLQGTVNILRNMVEAEGQEGSSQPSAVSRQQ